MLVGVDFAPIQEEEGSQHVAPSLQLAGESEIATDSHGRANFGDICIAEGTGRIGTGIGASSLNMELMLRFSVSDPVR